MSDHQEQIFLEYDKRRVRRNLLVGAWFAFITISGYVLGPVNLQGVAYYVAMGLTVLVGGALAWVSWRNWRCPSCDRALDRGTPRHCPHCGTRLVP